MQSGPQKNIFPKPQRRTDMNTAEKLDAIAGVLQDEDLCAEAMVVVEHVVDL